MVTWQGCIQRILILAIGVFVGVIMYVWMAFMDFEGVQGIMDYRNSRIGLVGSVLILIGGMLGACTKRWVALLPGTILILIAWASVYSVIWIFVVLTVLLLCYCPIPQENNLEEMHIDLTTYSDSARDVGDEMEERYS